MWATMKGRALLDGIDPFDAQIARGHGQLAEGGVSVPAAAEREGLDLDVSGPCCHADLSGGDRQEDPAGSAGRREEVATSTAARCSFAW
jgi:hypothetical protein